MKKVIKWTAVIGAACCIAGAGIMTLGAMNGGALHMEQALRHMDGWNGYRWFGWPGRWYDDWYEDWYEDWADGAAEGTALQNLDFQGVRKLRLELYSDVVMEESEELEEGGIRILRQDEEGYPYRCRQEGSEVKIDVQKAKDLGHVRIEDIVIQVPRGFGLTELEIENFGGSFVAGSVDAENLSLESYGGSIRIDGGSAEELEAESYAGEILCQAATERKASIESYGGQVEAVLAGAYEDYDYDVKATGGTVTVDGMTRSGVYHSQPGTLLNDRKVEIETTGGDVTVNFLENQAEN